MDSFVLYGPGGGSPLQIGSWVQVDPGADFGTVGLTRPQFIDTPFTEGALAFEDTGPRHMSFPLLVGSGAWGSLTQTESLLRRLAQPGGYIDLQPENVPSAEAVRFDILSGRWEPAYKTPLNRVQRRQGNLLLDTKPYGYWPTWITLASVASISGPYFTLTIPNASIIGDAPGLAEIWIGTGTTASYALGSPLVDGLAWSLNGHNASFVPFINAGSWGAASVAAAAMPSGVGQYVRVPTGNLNPLISLSYVIQNTLEAAYRGRYRAFALVNAGVASGLTAVVWQQLMNGDPIATANQFATAISPVTASAFQVMDLGEIGIPAAGSGLSQLSPLMMLSMGASSANGTAVFGGLFLQAIDGYAGVVKSGLLTPTPPNVVQQNGFYIGGDADLMYAGAVFAGTPPYTRDLRRFMVGPVPRMGASTTRLDVLLFQRDAASGKGVTPIVALKTPVAPVSVRYKPRFQFLKGL